MPDDLARIERDLEDLETRIRKLENIESPMLSSALREFRSLQTEVRSIQEQGAIETRGQLARINDRVAQNTSDIREVEEDVKQKADAQTLKELADDRKALVRIALAAVVAALLSLGVSLILRATGNG